MKIASKSGNTDVYKIKNCATGQYLETRTRHMVVTNLKEPWDKNWTVLNVEDHSDSNNQLWEVIDD